MNRMSTTLLIVCGAVLMAALAMPTLYGQSGRDSKSRSPITPDPGRVDPPPTDPDFRTDYLP